MESLLQVMYQELCAMGQSASASIHSLTFTACGRIFGTFQLKATLRLESMINVELVNCSFRGNFGGIYAVNSNLIFIGNTTFIGNNAVQVPAGISVMYCSLSSNGSIHFINNSYTLVVNSNSPATTIWASTSSLSFAGTSNFINNAGCGSAIYALYNTSLRFSGASNFINNLADSACYGGAISAEFNTSLSFAGTSNFVNNSAVAGGAIYATDRVSLSFTGTSNFICNRVNSGFAGGAIILMSNSSLSFVGTSNFINNSAGNGDGGAIYAEHNTSLSFTGTSNFFNNSAPDSNGGGVYLSTSRFFILPNTTVHWEKNRARFGGAIYVDDQYHPFIYCNSTHIEARKDKCFFQLPGQNLSNGIDVQFAFNDNHADSAGSVLYGGAVDNCTLTDLKSYGLNSGEVFDMLINIEDENATSSISSVPFRVCSCEGNQPNCSRSGTYTVTVYPGETFYVSLIAFGQRNGIVPTAIRIQSQAAVQGVQCAQETNTICTNLSYTVFSRSDYAELELYADGPCTTFSDELVLHLHINQTCPPGFNRSKTESSCVCEQRLKQYTTRCSITDGLGHIIRDPNDQFWVGYNQSHGLILHPHCPLDYCVSGRVVEFPLNNTDLQCVNHRSGLLCGACKEGYSLVLGTSQCVQCTNSYLALLILFALMGIALVLLLLVCKLTVAAGTLSGIVFYANIVGVNRTYLLPVETTDALSVFIAWLNLDFGVESCFYNGMDAYSKTWLQFVFPVYIWVIVGFLILVSHFSDKFAKLCMLGNNPVSVLATLILLSYAKVLRTIIAAIYFTYLEYPTYNQGVWVNDANIDYLTGKHIPLFLMAMFFFLFLFLPYTILLLFGQWLQAISHLRMFPWVNRLKPFMDSYHAPYKAKHRYWPGLLLVLRFGLLLIFAFNPQQNPSTNLLAISVGTGTLTIWAWISGGIYRNWCLNALEGSFALNLIILVVATYHVKLSGGNQLAVGYTSVAIALVTFIGILVYHIFQQARTTQLWKTIPKLNQEFNVNHVVNKPEVVEDFSQFREPLLEDPPKLNYGAF